MRTYFYNDESGKLKKYLYCSRGCTEPYKQIDIGIKLFKANQNTLLCRRCISELGLKCDLLRPSITDATPEPVYQEPQQELEVKQDVIEQSPIETESVSQPESAFIVYVLQCKDKTFYVGITANLENAVKYHNGGCGSTYTKPKERRPVVVVQTKSAENQEEAKKVRDELRKKYMG